MTDRADSLNRFSDRVADYVRFRPHYPELLYQTLAERIDLRPQDVVADVGAGTGIASELFLKHGHAVIGVEPNAAMRHAASLLLAQYPQLTLLEGTAEALPLKADSVDLVVAAQAFHWFNRPVARREFARVLKPTGWVVLIWNTRKLDSTPFLRAYEQLLQDFGTDYREVQHTNINDDDLREFFAPHCFDSLRVATAQRFDLDGVRGRLLSSSYTPGPDDARFEPMLAALDSAFADFQTDGGVDFEYETEMYWGRVAP